MTDDGVGLDPARRRNGLGLRGIDERVKELDGTMTIARAGGRRHHAGSPVAAAGSARRRCRLRVLLADDHSIVRRGLRGLLEAAGLTVVAEASDGLEAMRLCEEHHPDLLILDIGMPKLSGIEVAARAQKMERPPGVIILSVHGDESYIMRALAAGARAYLLEERDRRGSDSGGPRRRRGQAVLQPGRRPPCSSKTTSGSCSSAD